MYMCDRICMFVYICVYIYIYIHMFIYISTYWYIYIYKIYTSLYIICHNIRNALKVRIADLVDEERRKGKGRCDERNGAKLGDEFHCMASLCHVSRDAFVTCRSLKWVVALLWVSHSLTPTLPLFSLLPLTLPLLTFLLLTLPLLWWSLTVPRGRVNRGGGNGGGVSIGRVNRGRVSRGRVGSCVGWQSTRVRVREKESERARDRKRERERKRREKEG